MIGFYNYTVYLTYLSLISSVFGISFAFEGNPDTAVLCLLFSGFCDLFDGKVARTKKDRTDEEKRFGIQIDSLCDIVCFGVLPAAISFPLSQSVLQTATASLFVLCGLIRLAYFNVTEETRQQQTNEARKFYLGLPITLSSLFVPLLWCFRTIIGDFFPAAYGILLALLAFFYICPIKIKKPGKAGTVILILSGAAILALGIILN